MKYTVTKLATKCNISRATVLYYEREGLLAPAIRSENGYRWYGEKELDRLKKIIAFRSYGISVADILLFLDRKNGVDQNAMLRTQFEKIEESILALRKQQRAIVEALQQPELMENNMLTKERWVDIMAASGMSHDDMLNWHRNFEKMEPEEHQLFLESLGIDQEEIAKIRRF